MTKQSKVTVKHYINDKLKANGFSERKKYPIYVRVSFLRKNFRFRSTFLKWYYAESDFEVIENKRIMDYETKIINFIVNKNEDIQDLSEYLYLLKYDIIHIVKQDILTNKNFDNTNFYEKLTLEISNLIHSKTKLNPFVINHILKIEKDIDNDFFAFFDENLIEHKQLKEYLLFVKTLLKFENEIYKNDYFNCYEWKYNDGKLKFTEYFRSNNLNFSEIILLIDRYIERNEDYKLN